MAWKLTLWPREWRVERYIELKATLEPFVVNLPTALKKKVNDIIQRTKWTTCTWSCHEFAGLLLSRATLAFTSQLNYSQAPIQKSYSAYCTLCKFHNFCRSIRAVAQVWHPRKMWNFSQIWVHGARSVKTLSGCAQWLYIYIIPEPCLPFLGGFISLNFSIVWLFLWEQAHFHRILVLLGYHQHLDCIVVNVAHPTDFLTCSLVKPSACELKGSKESNIIKKKGVN